MKTNKVSPLLLLCGMKNVKTWQGWSQNLGYDRPNDMFILPLMAFPQDAPDTYISALITTRVDVPPLQ